MYFNNCKDNCSYDKQCYFCYPVTKRENNDDNCGCGCPKGYHDDYRNDCNNFDKDYDRFDNCDRFEKKDCGCNRKPECNHNKKCGFCICFKRLFW